MNSPSNHQQKVKVCYEQQLREIRIRRNRLRGILHNDIRGAERRTPRRWRTPGTSAPADAGSPRGQWTYCTSAPADAGSSSLATCCQAKRAETCRSCPSCQAACSCKAWTHPSGATPPCASAPFRPPPPHPELCALLGEAGGAAVAGRCATCMGMD